MTNSHIIAKHAYGTNASYHNHKGWVVPDSARCNGVGHWIFHPFFRGGSTKNRLHLNRLPPPPPPPLYFMTSPLQYSETSYLHINRLGERFVGLSLPPSVPQIFAVHLTSSLFKICQNVISFKLNHLPARSGLPLDGVSQIKSEEKRRLLHPLKSYHSKHDWKKFTF